MSFSIRGDRAGRGLRVQRARTPSLPTLRTQPVHCLGGQLGCFPERPCLRRVAAFLVDLLFCFSLPCFERKAFPFAMQSQPAVPVISETGQCRRPPLGSGPSCSFSPKDHKLLVPVMLPKASYSTDSPSLLVSRKTVGLQVPPVPASPCAPRERAALSI